MSFFDHFAELSPEFYLTIALCVLCVALGVLQMYGLNQFNKLKHMTVIQIRFPNIVQTEAVLIALVLLLVIPISLLQRQWIIDYEHRSDTILSRSRDILKWWINPAITYFMSHIEATRLWLMYFQLKLLESLQNEEWCSKITSNYWRHDFYLKNRSKLGNWKWMVNRVTVYWILISSVSGLSVMYLDEYQENLHYGFQIGVHLLTLLLLVSPLGFIAFLYLQAPKTIEDRSDNMMIDEEFKMTCYVFAVSLGGYVLSLISFVFSIEIVQFGMVFVSWIFTLTAPSFVATLWIPRKIRKHLLLEQMERCHGPFVLDSGLFKDREFNADGTKTESVMEEIQNLFLNQEKMRALARWMMRDCSLESFLAFVEMVQFKESIIAVVRAQNVPINEVAVRRNRFKLYGHCPKSSIVFNGNELEDGGVVVVEMEEIKEEEEEEEEEREEEEEEEREEVEEVGGHRMEEEMKGRLHAVSHHVLEEVSVSGNIPSAMDNNADAQRGGGISDNGQSQCEDNGNEQEMTLRTEDVERFKHIQHLLFEKYVSRDAVWEINIAGTLRDRYYRLEEMNYDPLQPEDWIQLNDEALEELWYYILKSYHRMILNLYCAEQE